MPTVDSTAPRSRIHDPDHDQPPPAPTPRPAAPSPRADHAIDANVAAAARNAFNDRILYVGFNATSRAPEVSALGQNVSVIAGSSSSEVKVGAVAYDLATNDGVKAFAAAICGTPQQEAGLRELLQKAPIACRDELGKMAQAWAPAERGEAIPSRLVLSGHSGGWAFWGDNSDDGQVAYERVQALARVFPRAAAQIEDVHFASCNSERHIQESETWRASFPNLKTMWGYGGTSPLAPTADLHAWEVATRGRTQTLGEGLMRSHGVATAWSVRGGVANSAATVEERRARFTDASSRFGEYFLGTRAIANPHEPAAERDYSSFRMLAAAHDATPSEKASATAQADAMMRLRYWNTSVRGAIAETYGARIDAAFRGEGLPVVDFKTLSRQDALAAIEQYRQKHGSVGSIMTGILELNATTIPDAWCR